MRILPANSPLAILHRENSAEAEKLQSPLPQGFYDSNKKVRIRELTRTENTKWGGSFRFSTSPLPEKVQLFFVKITAKQFRADFLPEKKSC